MRCPLLLLPLAAAVSSSASTASAFAIPSTFAAPSRSSPGSALLRAIDSEDEVVGTFDPLGLSPDCDAPASASASASSSTAASPFGSDADAAKSAAAASLAWSYLAPPAPAAGPDWGAFEGRIGSLLHPVAMSTMFLLSLSTGYLGLQWRRQREIGNEISALKRSLPDLGGAKTVAEAIAAAEGNEEVDGAAVEALKKALPVESEIESLTAERKELSSQGLRDKHYNQGALLAFIGTAFAIEGPLNTYARAGKLFPGPHLYAGAGVVVCWSAAAACVPFMSKGSDTARSIHIAANAVGVGLFAWQVTTGWPILLKVVELTKWP